VLCSGGKAETSHVDVADLWTRFDSVDAGCVRHGSPPPQIDEGLARHRVDLWTFGTFSASDSGQARQRSLSS
jgi:hypothetical protein